MLNSSDKIVTTKALGKIILSGEHSILYGCPALAMAVDHFCRVDLHGTADNYTSFNLLNYGWLRTFAKKDLLALKTQLVERYQAFLQGKISSGSMFDEPGFLAVYATVFFATRLFNDSFCDMPHGLDVTISSTVPVGCGMGSSAALIVALGRALQEFSAQEVSSAVFLSWSKEIENLQHGYSSGIDLYLAYHGGTVLFDNQGSVQNRTLPDDMPLRLINTGSAQSSTRECVMQAQNYFVDKNLLMAFADVTVAMDKALQYHDYEVAQECVRENNKLLCCLGVVPEKAQQFIAEIEHRGLAAKISGAGSVRGDTAGVVLVFGQGYVDDLLLKYGYMSL